MEVVQCLNRLLGFLFKKGEDYQYLLTKSLSALEIHDSITAVEDSGQGTNPKNKPVGNKEFFPKNCSSEKDFPFHEFFKRQLKGE